MVVGSVSFDSGSSSPLCVVESFLGRIGGGCVEFEVAMAMRRLGAYSLRARRFCSSSTGPAELSGVQEITKPVSTHGEIGEVSGIPEKYLKRKVRGRCCDFCF